MMGDMIKRLRREKGLTQEELAEKVGCARSTIKSIETNRNNPGPELLKKISDFFGVEPLDLENETNEKKEDSFTMDLLKRLVDEGYIEDPDNINKTEMEVILSAIKLHNRKYKK
jgi:XRE family transcriptional regulator of biofilm formation